MSREFREEMLRREAERQRQIANDHNFIVIWLLAIMLLLAGGLWLANHVSHASWENQMDNITERSN